MALRDLHPVRLADGFTSDGIQLVVLRQEDWQLLLLLAPELLKALRKRRGTLCPGGSIALELAAVSHGGAAGGSLRSGLHLRVRLPRETQAKAVREICRAAGDEAVAWLRDHGVDCDLAVEGEKEGLVNLYPAEGAHMRCLMKERRMAQLGGRRVFYYAPLRPLTAVAWDRLALAVADRAEAGLSLHLLPETALSRRELTALREQSARDPDISAALTELTEAEAFCASVLTVWGRTEAEADALVQAVQGILQAAGIFLAVNKPRSARPTQWAQLVYDPWALYAWHTAQLGVRLASTAFLLTNREIDGLFRGTGPAAAGSPAIEPQSAAATEDILLRCADQIGDRILSELLEKLRPLTDTQARVSGDSGILTRLDALAAQTGAVSGQLERLDAIAQAQQAVYLHRMDVLEASLTETVNNAAAQVTDQLRTGLERVAQDLAELGHTAKDLKKAVGQLEGAVPPGFDLSMTAEELQSLGVGSEAELEKTGLLPQEIRLLRIALALARLGVSQADGDYMPFGVPLGCLYEMVVHNSLDPKITPCDLKNRKEEYEQRQSSGTYQPRRPLPENPADVELSFYDYISPGRVCEGFFKHVFVDGRQLMDPTEWNIWFCCFKTVRAVRNKVHPQCGKMEKQELTNLYNLMIVPGSEYKWESIRYLANHPSKNTNGLDDQSLKIRHYNEKRYQGTVADLERYIRQYGARTMQESLLHFLLRLRRSAEWREPTAQSLA